MATQYPVICIWDGEALVPAGPVWARRADQQWVVGERYQVELRQDRSAASHRHFFAAIHEAWQNLPEDAAERFQTSEHLRKWALIRAGYRDERTIVASSKAEAQRLAAFIRPMDDYAVVLVSGAVVKVCTAKSQSVKAMGRKEFEESKAKVLDVIAGLLGTTADALRQNAGQAA